MAEWVTGIVTGWGLWGVAFLMFLEHLFPPIPSELILPLAGVEAARRDLPVTLMIAVATAGSVAGLTVWYVAAIFFGKARLLFLAGRFGRILTVKPSDIEKIQDWFDRYGTLAVLFGRLLPTIRTLISVPAGFAAMPLGRFLIYSAIGSLIWTALLVLAGVWLGAQGGLVERLISPVSDAMLVLIVVTYIWRVATYRR